MTEIRIFETVDAIAEKTFEILTEPAQKNAAEAKGTDASAALSFGATYEGIFSRWNSYCKKSGREGAALPALFPADERVVDFSDPASNWAKAVNLFINENGSESDLQRWPDNINKYTEILGSFFGDIRAELPVFDVIFLGLGSDGHTASLFPENCPLPGTSEWNEPVLKTVSPFEPPDRLTLGPEVISICRKLVMVVTGESKKTIFRRFVSEIQEGNELDIKKILPPSRIIRERQKRGYYTLIITDLKEE